MHFAMVLFGVLNVKKPAGITSRDAVDRVQRLVRPAKTGHAGTLDPLATGVLVICVGQATRLIRYVQQMRKHYRATFLLGRHSETDDIEGPVSEIPNAKPPSRQEIDRVLPQFVGEIRQRPPAHSAIKIGGRRAYKLARQGASFEIADRAITVYRIEVQKFEYPELQLDIECGSGTYVRALGRDIGAALGTGAVMSALERTAIGPFSIEQAVALDCLTTESLLEHVQPGLATVADLPSVQVSDAQAIDIRNGLPIPMPAGADYELPMTKSSEWTALNSTGQLIAILHEKCSGQLWPAMNLT